MLFSSKDEITLWFKLNQRVFDAAKTKACTVIEIVEQ